MGWEIGMRNWYEKLVWEVSMKSWYENWYEKLVWEVGMKIWYENWYENFFACSDENNRKLRKEQWTRYFLHEIKVYFTVRERERSDEHKKLVWEAGMRNWYEEFFCMKLRFTLQSDKEERAMNVGMRSREAGMRSWYEKLGWKVGMRSWYEKLG